MRTDIGSSLGYCKMHATIKERYAYEILKSLLLNLLTLLTVTYTKPIILYTREWYNQHKLIHRCDRRMVGTAFLACMYSLYFVHICCRSSHALCVTE